MSACISIQGEYSNHVPDAHHVCTRCGVLDEDALVAELVDLRQALTKAEADRDDWKAGHERALRDREAVEAEMDRRLVAAWSERDAARLDHGNALPEWEQKLLDEQAARDTESYCHRCDGPNISWSAPSPLWNAVMRDGSIDGEWQWNEIVCPICFATLAEERGIADGWLLKAERVHVELETVTPSGRVWDEATMLWRDPPAAVAS